MEQLEDGELEELRQRLTWSGDRNFYEGFDAFWVVRRWSIDAPPDILSFEGWKARWGAQRENLPKAGAVPWRKLPAAARPLHSQGPADYLLNESGAANPVVEAASDGHNIGFLLERLPLPPPEPAAK